MLRWAHINEKSAMFSTSAPFALSLSKGKRGVFQHPARTRGKGGQEMSKTESGSVRISGRSTDATEVSARGKALKLVQLVEEFRV